MQFATVFSSLLLLASTAVAGGFDRTCNECTLGQTNNLYGCYCKNAAGKRVYTILDLNTCLINRDGGIFPQRNGGFAASCSKNGQVDQYAPCFSCRNNGGGQEQSCPFLSGWISNQNGVLSCDY